MSNFPGNPCRLTAGISSRRKSFFVRAFFICTLLLTGQVHAAAARVSLSIENAADANGGITVAEGAEIQVSYKIKKDPEKLLGKKDEIQLVRVKDDSVVDSVSRGKEKSGTVSLKVSGSAGEQLYVRYIAKKGDLLVAQTSHPSEAGFVPLMSVAISASGGGQTTSQDQQTQATAQTGTQAATSNPSNIKSFDILGIGLGIGLTDANQLLTSSFPDYLVVPVNYDSYGRQWTGILAAMPPAGHRGEVVLVDFAQAPLEQRAIAVTRYKEYPAGATPSLENLEKSLVNKYGEWSKADATTRGGYRKIYYWWGKGNSKSCMDERLHAPWGRLKQIVEEGSLSRVLGDAYGNPGRYISAFRDYAQYSDQTPACGKQITAEVKYRPDQPMSPINALITVVADYPAYFQAETEFSKMAEAFTQQQAEQAVQKGGEPAL